MSDTTTGQGHSPETKFALLEARVDDHDERLRKAEASIENYRENRARLTGVVWFGSIASAVMCFLAAIATIYGALK